jgi:hypothetical protein
MSRFLKAAAAAGIVFAGFQGSAVAAEVVSAISFYRTTECNAATVCTLAFPKVALKQRFEVLQVSCRYVLLVDPDPNVASPDTREVLLDVVTGTKLNAEYPLQPFFAGVATLDQPDHVYINVNEDTFIPMITGQQAKINVVLNATGAVKQYGCTIAGKLYTTTAR